MTFRSSRRGDKRLAVRLVSLACMAALGWTSLPSAALPSPVKPTHPRILLTPERLRAVREAVVPTQLPGFPLVHGRMTFEIVPQYAQHARPLEALLDEYANRNHIFFRHRKDWDLPASDTVVFQLTLQRADETYVVNTSVPLPVGVKSTVELTWHTGRRELFVSVNGGSPTKHSWTTPWQPDQQQLVLYNGGNDPVAGDSLERLLIENVDTTETVLDRRPADWRLQRGWEYRVNDLRAAKNKLLQTCTTPLLPSCSDPFDLLAAHPGKVESLAADLSLAYLITDDTSYLQAALNYADKLLAIDPLASGEYSMGGRVGAFSFLYDWLFDHLSPNLREQLGRRVIDHIVARPPVNPANPNAYRRYELGSQVCGGLWSQAVESSPLRCRTEPWIEWHRTIDANRPSISESYLGTHAHRNLSRIGQALLAMHDEFQGQSSATPDVRPLLDTVYRHQDEGFNATREWLSIDGGHHMGYFYPSAEYNNPLMGPLLWQTALLPIDGRPVMTEPSPDNPLLEKNDWRHKLWLPYAYGLRGDNLHPASGDGLGYGLTLSAGVVESSSQVLQAAVNGRDGHAAWFYKNVLLPRSKLGYFYDRLYFDKPEATPQPLGELPLARHFRNAGFVTMRDSWNFADAALLDFKSTSFVSLAHQHLDQNSFTLFYRTPLLLDTGYYDAFGTHHWNNYYTRTIAHNTLVVHDPAESFVRLDGGAWRPFSNDGGQWYRRDAMATYPTPQEAMSGGPNHLAGIETFAQGEDYSYGRGNASRAYAPEKLDPNYGFIRHVVMLRNPTFRAQPAKPVVVVYDTVKLAAGRESLEPTVLFHTAQEPHVQGTAVGAGMHAVSFGTQRRLFDVVNGAGRLFIETLLPVNATFGKVGGQGTEDYRFRVPTLRSGSTPVNHDLVPGSTGEMSRQTDIGDWRIEVGAPRDTTSAEPVRRDFLHVLSVTDASSTDPAPSALKLKSSSYSAAVLLGNQTVVMVHEGDPAQGLFWWDVPPGLPFEDFLVVGLLPSARFSLSHGPVPNGSTRVVLTPDSQNGNVQTTEQGALRIR